MGLCYSPEYNSNATKRSREIDIQLRAMKQQKKDFKILLLGPGESGKSTVFKQMKIIQDGGGFSDEERKTFTHVVHSNCISQMRVLVQAATKSSVNFSNPENEKRAADLLALTSPHGGNLWTTEIGESIKYLWVDAAIRSVLPQAGKDFQLNDTADYFFDRIDLYLKPDYIPSTGDVLRVRVRSTGIEEAEFKFDSIIFKVVDVGGQRSERRKWIHCFDCVTTVLFCASLSGYDQFLREDSNVNRMTEALDLFDEVINSPWFSEANMILFLNKTDLFTEKIKRGDLKDYFPNYEGGEDFQKASEFIASRFQERVANNTQVFIHFTCAINTDNIDHVINEVKRKILNTQIDDLGLGQE